MSATEVKAVIDKLEGIAEKGVDLGSRWQSLGEQMLASLAAAEARAESAEGALAISQSQEAELTRDNRLLTERCARLAKSLRNVPIFRFNGYTKTCTACGAEHWFDKGPPVVIHHKEGCWGVAILEFLALSDTAPIEREGSDGEP